MRKLDELISRLKSFQNEMTKVIEEVVRKYEYIILDMNATDQLYGKGITRKGVEIASFAPYANLTIEIKKLKGQPTSRVTLKDEGDFHSSFFIEYQADGFQIKADDWKTSDLMKRYGDEILGLTDDNFAKFANDYVKPALAELFIKL